MFCRACQKDKDFTEFQTNQSDKCNECLKASTTWREVLPIKQPKKKAICHPERNLHARGLCKSCYNSHREKERNNQRLEIEAQARSKAILKTCKRCLKEKPDTEFQSDKSDYCNICTKSVRNKVLTLPKRPKQVRRLKKAS